jgi:(+)-pinoresinol hydroxylase
MRRVLAGLYVALGSVVLWSQPLSAQDDAAVKRGNEIYQYWCATCHGRGPGNPGTTALAAKYKGGLPGVLEDRRDLTAQTIRFAVRRGTSVMPHFRKTEVSDRDLEAITQYLTQPFDSAQGRRGTRTGDVRKP